MRLAVLTAAATAVAYILAEVLPFADPIPAAITAAVTTRATFHHAAKESVFQTLGALLGAAIALVVVWVVGGGPLVILLLVLLCFALARLLHLARPDEAPFVAASMAVTVILVVGTHLTGEGALERFIGVAVGAACAIVASTFAAPTRETRVLRQDAEALQSEISDLLFRVSDGLREAPDPEVARSWYDEAVDLRNRSIGLDARLEDLSSHARWSPRIDPDDLEGLGTLLSAGRVMSARVLSLTADLTSSASGATSPIPEAARTPLADLIALTAENMSAEDPTTTIGATQAHQAVRVAEQTAQIAVIGGIVANIDRINRASREGSEAWDDDAVDDEHSAT